MEKDPLADISTGLLNNFVGYGILRFIRGSFLCVRCDLYGETFSWDNLYKAHHLSPICYVKKQEILIRSRKNTKQGDNW